jgi:hypothetical protein
MEGNNSQGLKSLCAILLIVYIPMLLGGIYNAPLLLFDKGFKENFIQYYGITIHSMSYIIAPLNIIFLCLLIVGTVQSIKLKGRFLLLIASSGYILFAIMNDMLFLFLGTSYIRFSVVSSWAEVPRPTVILSVFTIYFLTRPKVKEQFQKQCDS